ARLICFRLLRQTTCNARNFAFEIAGNSIAARMPITAITTSNSINVKPWCCSRTLNPPETAGLMAFISSWLDITQYFVSTVFQDELRHCFITVFLFVNGKEYMAGFTVKYLCCCMMSTSRQCILLHMLLIH